MIFIHMLARFKAFLLSLIGLVRRALCCFSRRRKPSYAECEVLTSVNVVHTKQHRGEAVERDWNSWDDSPRTVTEHIEQYRERLVQPKAVENTDPAVDFFQDMIPKVQKPKKIFIDTNKNSRETNFSRLQASSAAQIPFQQSAELEDWSDESNDEGNNHTSGWDETVVNDEITKQMIREKRREARAQRNQRLQQQKMQQQQMHGGLYAQH